MFLFCLVFAMSLCASVYMCFVVTCWERADLLALVCGVYCEFVTFPLVSWVRCCTWLYRFLIFAPLLTLYFEQTFCHRVFSDINHSVYPGIYLFIVLTECLPKVPLRKIRVHYCFQYSLSSQNPCDFPPCYCCHLGRHLEYVTTLKTTPTFQSNFPNTTAVENNQKIVINCDFDFRLNFALKWRPSWTPY